VAFKNESDVSLLVRGDSRAGMNDPVQWLLPPHSAGHLLSETGPPREDPPIDYEILDAASCRVLGSQRVDLALAPNPGYSEFIVVVAPDMRLRVDALVSADHTIIGDLESTNACPAP